MHPPESTPCEACEDVLPLESRFCCEGLQLRIHSRCRRCDWKVARPRFRRRCSDLCGSCGNVNRFVYQVSIMAKTPSNFYKNSAYQYARDLDVSSVLENLHGMLVEPLVLFSVEESVRVQNWMEDMIWVFRLHSFPHHSDNQSCIEMARNSVLQARRKHREKSWLSSGSRLCCLWYLLAGSYFGRECHVSY